MKPVIGIIAKSHTTYTDRTCMCALDGYRRAVSNCGGVPILIMPTQDICFEETRPREARKLTEEEKQDLIQQIKLCDGIILQGGTTNEVFEFFIAKYCYDNDIPCLGICA